MEPPPSFSEATTACAKKDSQDGARATNETAFWDAIFQNSYDFVLVTDAQGRMEYINRTLPGIRREDVLGTYPEDYFESPVRERVRAAIDRVVGTGRPQRLDAAFTTPAGAEHIFEAKVAPLGEAKPPARLIFNYHDITRRKRLEGELRLRETQMRTALENLPVLVNATGPDHRFRFWNRACETVTGYSAEEALDNPDIWAALYPDPEIRRELLENFPAHRDIPDSEWELRAKDGSAKIISWSAYGGSCPIPGWRNWAVGIDLTDHRRDRRALKAAERMYERILDRLPDSVTLCDPSGRILAANQTAARLRGFDSTAELLAEVGNVFDYVHPEDRERVNREARRSLDRGDGGPIEYRAIRRNGEPIPMELRIARLTDESVSPFQIIGISRDLREQKAAEAREREREEKLVQAARLASLGTMVSGLAHEINGPNSAISGNAQALRNIWNGLWPLLEEWVPADPEIRVGSYGLSELRDRVKRSLETIHESSKRISGMVGDLQAFGQPGTYRRDQFVDLAAVVEWARRLLEFTVKKAPCELKVRMEKTPPVLGNAKRLEQVVINLLQNALVAMEDRPGAVWIETGPGETAGTAEIRVLDEGGGIPEADRARVVDPYFTTRRARGGAGLGLTISDQIVRDHGGRLIFENRNGPGTRVRVVLPVGPIRDGSEA